MMIRLIAVLIAFIPLNALAGEPLNEDEVNRFVAAMIEAKELEEKYDEDFDVDFKMEDLQSMADDMLGPNGEVRLLTGIMSRSDLPTGMKDDAQKIAKQNGFSGREELYAVGDRLFLALIKTEMSQSELKELQSMSQITDSQMKMMPAQVLPMLKVAKALGPALEAVPAGDVRLAKKVKPQLEALEG